MWKWPNGVSHNRQLSWKFEADREKSRGRDTSGGWKCKQNVNESKMKILNRGAGQEAVVRKLSVSYKILPLPFNWGLGRKRETRKTLPAVKLFLRGQWMPLLSAMLMGGNWEPKLSNANYFWYCKIFLG